MKGVVILIFWRKINNFYLIFENTTLILVIQFETRVKFWFLNLQSITLFKTMIRNLH